MNPTPAAPKQTKKGKSKQKAIPLQYAVEPQNPAVLAKNLLSQDNITVPFPSPAPTSDTNWTFKYSPPESIVIVGSWAAGLSVKHQDKIDFGVDLAVAIPAVRNFEQLIERTEAYYAYQRTSCKRKIT
jgi:hypothetical protein